MLEIKAGDVVVVKNGITEMTVIKVKGENAECLYLNKWGNGELREEFPLAALKKVKK